MRTCFLALEPVPLEATGSRDTEILTDRAVDGKSARAPGKQSARHAGCRTSRNKRARQVEPGPDYNRSSPARRRTL